MLAFPAIHVKVRDVTEYIQNALATYLPNNADANTLLNSSCLTNPRLIPLVKASSPSMHFFGPPNSHFEPTTRRHSR